MNIEKFSFFHKKSKTYLKKIRLSVIYKTPFERYGSHYEASLHIGYCFDWVVKYTILTERLNSDFISSNVPVLIILKPFES